MCTVFQVCSAESSEVGLLSEKCMHNALIIMFIHSLEQGNQQSPQGRFYFT